MLVFIDFSGTVEEFASLGIGTCGDAAPSDAGGELLANFMVRWFLCAPATLIHVSRDLLPLGLLLRGSTRKDLVLLVLLSADLQMCVLLRLTRPLIFCRRRPSSQHFARQLYLATNSCSGC